MISFKEEVALEGIITIKNLTCNHLICPLGVDTQTPVFNWNIEGALLISGYRLLVADSIEKLSRPNLWDSGNQPISNGPYIRYAGKPFCSRQQVFWKVGVTNGKQWWWSDATYFEMGLISDSDWKGRWIGQAFGAQNQEELNCDNISSVYQITGKDPSPYFRKEFCIEKKITRARLYICGLGYFEVFINGKRVGNDVLTPGFTQYDKTVLYNTYDVTELLNTGENAIGVLLGNGFYNNNVKDTWSFQTASWINTPRLLLDLVIYAQDGSQIRVVSDSDWKVSFGSIRRNSLRTGHIDDARYQLNGWTEKNYDDENWEYAYIVSPPGGILVSSQYPQEQIIQDITPISNTQPRANLFVYDMGQNMTGWAQIMVSGPRGSSVRLRYGERLFSDGTVDQEHIGKFVESALFQTDYYVLNGDKVETWEPRFVYHGFQYVELMITDENITIENLRGRMVHTNLPESGGFSCSVPLLNKIQELCQRSILTNYHSIPTDCPHREKIGWTGDGMLSCLPTILNFDSYNAHRKWVSDIIDTQRPSGQISCIAPTNGWGYSWGSGPAWDSALIIIPWYLYLNYGDCSVLVDAYSAMKKYVRFLDSIANKGIIAYGLGDWNPPVGKNDEYICPLAITDTAYYYHDCILLSKISNVLGYPEEANYYKQKALKIRDSFHKSFFNPSTGSLTVNCQTSLSCVLYFNLVGNDKKHLVLKQLIKCIESDHYHINAGILGTQYIMEALSAFGRSDIAFRIATQNTFPSWGWWVEQGATTLWGNWDGESSRNHHMFSTISSWFFRWLGGIRTDETEPGYRNIIFAPDPCKGLDFVSCWHMTPYGRAESNWRNDKDSFIWDIIIPEGSGGTVYLPYKGKWLFNQKYIKVHSPLQLTSGRYLLELDKRRVD